MKIDFNSKKGKTYTKPVLLLLFAGLLVISGALYWGGVEIWETAGIIDRETISDEDLTTLKTQLQEEPDKASRKYNLGVALYRQHKFKEAETMFRELLRSNTLDTEMTRRIHYNLGNTIFRLAEEEENIPKALERLNQSLAHFHQVIQSQRRDRAVSGSAVAIDKDAQYNYMLVKTKIKVLNDQRLKQQEKEQDQRSLYRLAKQLKEKEAEISRQLEEMKKAPKTRETYRKRDQLLKMRESNLKQVQRMTERMRQYMKSPN